MSKLESLHRILKALSLVRAKVEWKAEKNPLGASGLIQKINRMENTLNAAVTHEKLGMVSKGWDIDPYQTAAEVAKIIEKELTLEKARRGEKAKPKLIEKASSDRATNLKKLKKIRHELADIMSED